MNNSNIGISLFFKAFLSGFISIGLEILGFRILSPYFGYSVYVSSALIGVSIFSFAVGYYLGGYFSKKTNFEIFFKIFSIIGYFWLLLISLFYNEILQSLSLYRFEWGVVLSAIFTLFIPSFALSSFSVYFLKIASVKGLDSVSYSGKIYGVGSFGSLFAIFLTNFFLIPSLGVKLSILFYFGCFALLCILIFSKLSSKILIVLIFLPSLFSLREKNIDESILYSGESQYGYLEIKDLKDVYVLKSNKGFLFAQSVFYKNNNHKNNEESANIYDMFEVSPFIKDSKRILLLGLGAGTIPYFYKDIPGVSLKAVEIDKKVVDLGFDFFHLDKAKNLEISIQDARLFLNQNKEKFDLVEVDLFRGMGETPFYLDTRESFSHIKKSLTKGGLMAMNIYDGSDSGLIINPTINTIASVFKNTYLVDLSSGSHFILASDDEINLEKLKNISSSYPKAINFLTQNIKKIEFNQDNLILTDDSSPLERLNYQAIFKSL